MGRKPDIPDIGATVGDASAQIFEYLIAGGPYIPPYDNVIGLEQDREKLPTW